MTAAGAASIGGLSQFLDTGLWTGPWEEGREYAPGQFAEDDIAGESVVFRALQEHTAALANRPSAAAAAQVWVRSTGNELLRALRLRDILTAVKSEAGEGQTPLRALWRGTRAQYDAIADKRDDVGYVVVG